MSSMRERSRTPGAETPPSGKDPIAAELGRRGGIKGGRARAERLPPELRRAIAQRAAATRWARVRGGAERGGEEQPRLPGTPRVAAVGTLTLAGRPLQVLRTDSGAGLLGQLSVEAALGATLAPAVPAVACHVPGEWRLKRGLTPETFVGLLAGRAAAGEAGAVELLAACAVDGLAPLVDGALPAAAAADPGPAGPTAAVAADAVTGPAAPG